jgi:hypothetical protein
MGNTDAKFSGSIFRKDHPMILASRRDLASIKPIKLAYNSDGYAAGTVLAFNTSTSKYVKYVDGQANGVGTAAAILFMDVPVEDFSSSADFKVERAIFGGEVFYSLLTGIDAAGIVDLAAKRIKTATGNDILKF